MTKEGLIFICVITIFNVYMWTIIFLFVHQNVYFTQVYIYIIRWFSNYCTSINTIFHASYHNSVFYKICARRFFIKYQKNYVIDKVLNAGPRPPESDTLPFGLQRQGEIQYVGLHHIYIATCAKKATPQNPFFQA